MTNRPTEDNLEKSLPSSPGAERAVLGAVLVTPSVMDEVSAKLAREDFYLQAHRMIFEVAGSLWRDSATVDIVTVVEELTMSGNLESVGGASYVSGLCDGVARSSSVSSYIGIIKEKSRLRRIISISNGILQKALGGEASSSEILAEMEGSCQPLVSSSSAFKSAGEVVNSQQGAIERILSNEPPVRGIPTGYHQLDRLLFGLQPSTLTVVAGRPSAGKSTFSLNVCEHVSMVLREPVALFSLEDSEESIFLRMVSSLSKASSTKLRSGFAGNLDKSAVVNSCARIAESPLWLDCSSSMTIAEMKMKARRIVREHGVKLIVLDYLQLATAGFKTENRNIEVGLISQALKA
ncbi:MAG: AAA family ATPase, partial [Patescibacteria group bacterium]|nr:AAA family ATPase [Patescibacteria group bacterium]